MKLLLSILLSLNMLAIERVISTSPAITQCLLSLGLKDRIVAQSTYDQLRKVPKIGTSIELNLEKVLQLKPDLILLEQSQSSQRTIKKLQKLKLNFSTLNLDNFKNLKDSLNQLGIMLKKESYSSQLLQALDSKMLQEEKKDKKAVLIFDQIIKNGKVEKLFYMGNDTLHGEVLTAAGYENSLPKKNSVPSLTIERLQKLNTDIIFVLYNSTPPKAAYQNTPLLKKMRTRYIKFKNVLINGPNIIDLKDELVD